MVDASTSPTNSESCHAPAAYDAVRAPRPLLRTDRKEGSRNLGAVVDDKVADQMVQQLTVRATDGETELLVRSPRAYKCRSAIAWLINLSVFFLSSLGILAYGLHFGERESGQLLVSWAVAVGQTFGFIEPIEIIVIVIWQFESSLRLECFELCLVIL